MVSERGARLAAETPQIAVAHFQAESDPYHPRRNPAGYVNLGTAENRLVWDLLAPALTAARPLAPSDTHYGPLYGTAPMREAVARFLSNMDGVGLNTEGGAEHRRAGESGGGDAAGGGDGESGGADHSGDDSGDDSADDSGSGAGARPGSGSDLDPEDVIVVSGATAALDIIASAICDPGDAIVVPAPYYGALDADLCGRSQARIVPAPQSSDTAFRSMPESVERAIDKAGRDGTHVRAIALTSPYNPVGHVYTEAELRAVAELAEEHDLQLIVDEIYANSVFGTDPFVSMLSPPPSVRPERVHVVWGFAKDFGLPGLKVGVLHTRDPKIREAARALAYFAPVSTDTQGLLCRMLDDADWVAAFLAENRKRLTASYVRATWMLKDHGIEAVPAGAGFSHWCDLRSWLTEPTFAAEQVLWRDIFATERVNVLPGEVFASPEPGWFRVCHTANPEVLDEGVARLGRYWTRRVERRKITQASSAATAAAG